MNSKAPRSWTAFACLLGLGISSACAHTNVSPLQRAQPTAPGEQEMSVEPGAWMIHDNDGTVGFGRLSLSTNFGLSERVDIGGRVGSGGVQASGRFMLSQPGASGPILTLGPVLGVSQLSVMAYRSTVILPLMVGLRLGSHELLLAPHLQSWMFFERGDTAPKGMLVMAGPGGSLGMSFQLSPELRLMPEIASWVPLTRNEGLGVGGSFESQAEQGEMVTQATVSLTWRRKLPTPEERKKPTR